MNREKEKGVALILTLILLAVLSAMTVSLMFLSQTETWSTMNYRLSSQARDGAEAGINAAANFFLNQNGAYPYALPATSGSDPTSNYTLTAYPVTSAGNPVILYGDSNLTSNYPYSTVISNYQTSGVGIGQIPLGALTVKYTTSAKLLAMRQVTPYGSTTPQTVQTWLITSDGTVDIGVRSAKEELSMILERPIMPVFAYAAFGTSGNCSALDLGGIGHTDSYDSAVGPGVQNYGGNVGTNGNLTTLGSGTVNGSLSTPRAGVGTCTSGNVTAYQGNLSQVTQGIGELPQNIGYPTPALPSPLPPLTSAAVGPTCGGLAGCTDNASKDVSLAPGLYGNFSANAGTDVYLSAGTYNLNSIQLNGNSRLIFPPNARFPLSGQVIFNIAGCSTISGSNCGSYLSTPVDLTGGSTTLGLDAKGAVDPTQFQIQYAGTGTIKLNGGAAAGGVVYAPNAALSLSGGGDFYGSVIGSTVTISGNGAIHYDRNLQNGAYTIAPWITQSFSWAKF